MKNIFIRFYIRFPSRCSARSSAKKKVIHGSNVQFNEFLVPTLWSNKNIKSSIEKLKIVYLLPLRRELHIYFQHRVPSIFGSSFLYPPLGCASRPPFALCTSFKNALSCDNLLLLSCSLLPCTS